eukprot:gene6182-2798_t
MSSESGTSAGAPMKADAGPTAGPASSNVRVISAGIAAVASSILTTPFDVVKTRMQTHDSAGFSGRSVGVCSRASMSSFPLRSVPLHGVKVELGHCGSFLNSLLTCLQSNTRSLPRPWRLNHIALCHCSTAAPSWSTAANHVEGCSATNTFRRAQPTMFGTMSSIYRQEGMRVLWRGLDSSLLMSVPMVGIYMPLYDYLKENISSTHPSGMNLGVYAPATAGMLARVIAVMVTAPLELVRTRQQALLSSPAQQRILPVQQVGSSSSSSSSSSSMWQVLRDALHSSESGSAGAVRISALTRLWSGVGATIARDVPFTAIYWSLLEPSRKLLLEKHEQPANDQVFAANMASGAGAGAIAAIATTPADVLKTRLQTSGGKSIDVLRQIWREERVAGLMRGWAPRAARAAPACAIVISSYELLKTIL